MESSLASTGAAPAPPAERPAPHVVLLSSPGAGHIIPLAELARRLVSHHGFEATLATFADLSTSDALSGLPASVATAELPPVPLDDLPADARIETVLLDRGGSNVEGVRAQAVTQFAGTQIIRRSLPRLRTLLRSISSTAPLAALVPDFFCSAALPLAAELGVPGYVFVPGNLTTLAAVRRVVELHDGVAPGEYRDLPVPLELPGGVSLLRADIPDGFVDSQNPVYAQLVDEGRRYRGADGLLVNTFYEMEPATVKAFEQAAKQCAFAPTYPVGPLVRSSSDEDGESACLEWLDLQPKGSVVYVSFGSGGALSVEQMAELAAGLEASGHRFLWVVRIPKVHGHGNDHQNPLDFLPEGFLERTNSRGLAVASWAPQVHVLSHPATAAFVSHCGWNSTLESVASGVPMIAWPLYAEQRLNAVILEENVGVTLRPLAREDGMVMREEIAAAVRELMEGVKGRAVRRQAGELQQAAARAWSPEGSSRRVLEEVAVKWKAALGKQK